MPSHVNGQNAPDFSLTDTSGQEVSLIRYRGDKHVVLVFTRGFV